MDIEKETAALQRIQDRLSSTPNEQLDQVLATLLPKLIPFANNEALRDKQIIPIFTHILRRIKLLKTVLPISALIKLIRSDMLPFGCNFAIAFMDTVVDWQPMEQWQLCGDVLIESLNAFAAFSSQSNALCYYSLYAIQPLGEVTRIGSSVAHDILGDFLLDIVLTQPGLVKGSAGSIQPGLSAERVDRLTAKTKEWTAITLKPFKLALIQSLPKGWLPVQCAVAIAIIASCDADTDVSMQAVFKMNGARSLLPNVKDHSMLVLDLLLKLCLPLSQSMQTFQQIPFVRQRTTLRENVKSAIVRWIARDMKEFLTLASNGIIQLVFSEMVTAASSSIDGSSVGASGLLYRCELMELTALLAEKLEPAALSKITVILIQCAKKALQPFISLLSTQATSSVDSEAGVTTREGCYRIIDAVARKCPSDASTDTDLLVLMFRLLDCERNSAVVKLYTALGGLREAYQSTNATVVQSSLQNSGTPSMALQDLITRSRAAKEPKKRCAAVQWARALFTWSPLVLETLLLLADDTNETVSKAVESEFETLRETILRRYQVLSMEVDENEEQNDHDDNEILLTVVHMVESPLLVRSAGVLENTQEMPLLIATEEVLHTAALVVRLELFRCTQYDSSVRSLSGPDSWPTLTKSMPSTLTSEILSRVVASAIHLVAPFAESHRTLVSSNLTTIPGLPRTAPLQLALILQHRAIMTAGIDLIHKCMLLHSDDLSMTHNIGSTFSSQLMSWLGTPQLDLGDPFGLFVYETTVSSSQEQVTGTANNHRSSSSPTTTSASANTNNNTGTTTNTMTTTLSSSVNADKRHSGCIRTQVAQILALAAASHTDSNVTSNYLRILQHKVQILNKNNPESVSTWTLSEQLTLAGAVSALGCTAETLVARRGVGAVTTSISTADGDGGGIIKTTLLTTLEAIDSLLTYMNNNNIASLDSQSRSIEAPSGESKSATAIHPSHTTSTEKAQRQGSTRHYELNIVALRVLSDLFERGALRASDDKTLEGVKQRLLDHLISLVKRYVSSISISGRVLSSTVTTSATITIAPMTTATQTLSSTESSSGSAASPGRSSAESKQISAVIDALSNACIAGVDTAFVLSVWELLLTLSASLPPTEAPLLRFALAEGLVRLSSIPVPPFPSTDSTEISMAQEGRPLPPLMQVLLGVVETAVLGQTATHGGTFSGKHVHIPARATAAAILLVLVTRVHGKDTLETTFSARNVVRCVELFLQLLREKDSALVQDLSCAGLCQLYAVAKQRDEPSLTIGTLERLPNHVKSLSEQIAFEVMATLCREKRLNAPAGVAVAGESTGTSAEGDVMRAIDRVLHPEENRPTTGGGGRGGNNGGGAVAGGGGGAPPPPDALQAAAATAAAEMGLNPQAVAAALNGARTNNTQNRNDADNGFGVYTTVCKVARKTGDSSVVFAVLALVRRDPSFGTGETLALSRSYRAPIARLDRLKTKELIPALFLAKHDPSPPIRDIMRQLWHILVTAAGLQTLVTTTLQGVVLAHLVRSLSSPQWRDREAACVALEGYLPLRSWSIVRVHCETLWLAGLSTLDDVRDGVRQAAMGMMKALAEQVLRASNPDEIQASDPGSTLVLDDAIALAMPLLLDKGIVASSMEARGFSFGMLVKIIKISRAALKDWLVRLVGVLVESMSALEPQMLQYMQFHTARLQISEEELETMRLRLAKESPMQEALDGCLQALGGRPNDIPETARSLRLQLQSGVGLATRVAAVQALSYLAETHPDQLGSTEHGAKALISIVDCLLQSPSMPVTLKRALLGGVGAMGKVVHAAILATTCDRLITKYESVGRDEAGVGPVIAACLLQIVSRAGDRLLDDTTWTRLLACSYAGTFDPSDVEASEAWGKLWPESLSGSGAGTKTNALLRVLPVVESLVRSLLMDLSWTRRKQGVQVIADLAVSVTPFVTLAPYLGSLIEALIKMIPGQIWHGQGQALEVLAMVVGKGLSSGHLDLYLPKDHLFVVALDLPQPPHQPSSHPSSSRQDDHSHRVVIHLDDALVRKTPHGGATDDVHALHGIGIDPPTTKAIAEALELTHASSSNISSGSGISHRSHGSDMYTWRVSLRGLLTLIVHETNRSDKEYQLSAARALSFLPWVSISGALAVLDNGSSSTMNGGVIPSTLGSTSATSSMNQKQSNQQETKKNNDAAEGLSIFDDYFAQLAALAGIPPYYTIAEEETDSNTTITGSIIDNKLQSLTKKAEKKGGHQPSGNALFGSRYGIDFNQKRNTLVNRRVTTTNVQGREYEEDVMLVTAGEHHVADDPVEDSTDHDVMMVDVDPVVSREHEMHVVDGVNEHGGSDIGELSGSVHRESEPMVLGQTSLEDAVATTDPMDVVASVNDQNSSSSSSMLPSGTASVVVTKSSSSRDPAFRVKILDCLCQGWPSSSSSFSSSQLSRTSDADGLSITSSTLNRTMHVVTWAASAAGDPIEIWSIRQAALQILGAVLSGYHLDYISKDDNLGDNGSPKGSFQYLMSTVIEAFTQCAGDVKHSKLRVAALKCLERIVRGATATRPNKESFHDQMNIVHAGDVLAQTCRDEVRAVLRSAATDGQPTVLEAAAKAQECWLSLLSMR